MRKSRDARGQPHRVVGLEPWARSRCACVPTMRFRGDRHVHVSQFGVQPPSRDTAAFPMRCVASVNEVVVHGFPPGAHPARGRRGELRMGVVYEVLRRLGADLCRGPSEDAARDCWTLRANRCTGASPRPARQQLVRTCPASAVFVEARGYSVVGACGPRHRRKLPRRTEVRTSCPRAWPGGAQAGHGLAIEPWSAPELRGGVTRDKWTAYRKIVVPPI